MAVEAQNGKLGISIVSVFRESTLLVRKLSEKIDSKEGTKEEPSIRQVLDFLRYSGTLYAFHLTLALIAALCCSTTPATHAVMPGLYMLD